MLNINGVDKLKEFVGTRKEIYNFIAKQNPLAIIDYRQARVKIDNVNYLIILKKLNSNFKIRIIWDTTNNIQYEF